MADGLKKKKKYLCKDDIQSRRSLPEVNWLGGVVAHGGAGKVDHAGQRAVVQFSIHQLTTQPEREIVEFIYSCLKNTFHFVSPYRQWL